MTKNPIVNALGASVYILLGVVVMSFVTKPLADNPDTFFAPVVFLSLLTLSVAVMAFMFFYQPLQLLIDGKKKESFDLLLKTIGAFGLITAVTLFLLFFGVI